MLDKPLRILLLAAAILQIRAGGTPDILSTFCGLATTTAMVESINIIPLEDQNLPAGRLDRLFDPGSVTPKTKPTPALAHVIITDPYLCLCCSIDIIPRIRLDGVSKALGSIGTGSHRLSGQGLRLEHGGHFGGDHSNQVSLQAQGVDPST